VLLVLKKISKMNLMRKLKRTLKDLMMQRKKKTLV